MSAVLQRSFLGGCLVITVFCGPRSLALLVEGVRGPYPEVTAPESSAAVTPIEEIAPGPEEPVASVR